jgi:hypothetical protein
MLGVLRGGMSFRNKLAMTGALLVAFSLSLCCASAQEPTHYHVDQSWPGELPHNWGLGHVESVVVDKDDHVWALHFTRSMNQDERGLEHNPPLSECCIPAPAVIEFGADGKVIKSWGGPGFVPDWPAAEQALWIDKMGNVWVAGSWYSGFFVRRPEDDPNISVELEKLQWDRHALKFSKDGKLLLEIGHPSKDSPNNQDTSLLGGVSSIQVDERAHEVYFADGYINRRIVVYDSETGKFKRGWGAYGISLSEIANAKPEGNYDPSAVPSKQFRGPLVGLRISDDGLVYVGDGQNDRIQVFTKQGKFIKEFFVAPKTLGEGSVSGLAFSRDPKQKYLLVADGANSAVRILNREDGSEVTRFGHKSRNVGMFSNLHSVDMDSHGNIYTGEVRYSNRIQKFVPQK